MCELSDFCRKAYFMDQRQVDHKGLREPQTTEDSSATLTRHKDTRKTSRLAISSMICSIIGISFATAHFEFGRYGFFQLFDSNAFAYVAILFFPTAFALAIIACVVITLRRKYLKGYSYTVVPFCLLLMWISALAVVGFRKITHAYIEKNFAATYNLRQLGRVMSEYSEDHDGYLPVANQWCDILMEYDGNLSESSFKHPVKEGSSIAFNKNLDGLRLADVPGKTVLLFEAEGGWNLTGGPELLKKECINRDFVDVLLVNKDIKSYWIKNEGFREHSEDNFKPLRWKP